MALPAQSPLAAPSPVRPGAGRSSVLPRDPGRATEWLYRRHGHTVFRYAWHLLGRREDAEDATQATFLAVHKALAGGTAVIDSSAWVLRIARNECMGRLRQLARRPAVSLDDGFDPPAAGGVERSAELRDEVRTASKTLRSLPEPEREAFVMCEWLGLEAGEAALALGLTAGDVDGLASRARRSLVLAVGGLEPAIGCAGTRSALEAGSLDRAAKVHLLRCPVCRGVRRALRPPDAAARPLVVERLSAAIPGFAGGGGILAALTAKAATAPVLAKTAAIVVAAVAAGGAAEQAIIGAHPGHQGKSHGGQAQVALPPTSNAAQRSGAALVVSVTAPRSTDAATVSLVTRGAAVAQGGRHGSSTTGSDDRGGRSSVDTTGSDKSGKAGGESGDHKASGLAAARSSSGGKHAAGSESTRSGTSHGGDGAPTSGSDTSGTHAGSGVRDSSSGKGSAPAATDHSGDRSTSAPSTGTSVPDSGTSPPSKDSAPSGGPATPPTADATPVVTVPPPAGGSD